MGVRVLPPKFSLRIVKNYPDFEVDDKRICDFIDDELKVSGKILRVITSIETLREIKCHQIIN
jgi:hypothetical protein